MRDTTKIWRTSRRDLHYGDQALVMAILNVTPDSFSDGGATVTVDAALGQAERFVAEGADIIDIGGESTRPGSARVDADEEIRRVVPVVNAITSRFDVAVSVDTSKSEVARMAIGAGAEIINDVSALRFDERIGQVAADSKCGLVLMHSRGEFESMHSQKPVADIMAEVSDGLRAALETAKGIGITHESIALDVGIGFGKTQEENLELIARLDKLTTEFSAHPIIIGTSRKSFLGKILNGAPVDKRLSGSLATAAIAIWNGAAVVRVHDVKETVELISTISAVREQL